MVYERSIFVGGDIELHFLCDDIMKYETCTVLAPLHATPLELHVSNEFAEALC